jgi:hypothetical protein
VALNVLEHGVQVFNNASIPALTGKAVAVEPATGFTFDTAIQPVRCWAHTCQILRCAQDVSELKSASFTPLAWRAWRTSTATRALSSAARGSE